MREPKKALGAWPSAARAVARWLERDERLDMLIESRLAKLAGAERAQAQQLVLGTVRHFGRLEAARLALVSRTLRPLSRATLLVMGAELLEAGDVMGRAAKIVHHAVEQAKELLSAAEVRMINAVGRKLADRLTASSFAKASEDKLGTDTNVTELAEFFSHPAWLIERWQSQFGAEATRALLAWNQTPGVVYVRWRLRGEMPPDWLRPTRWPEFFEVPAGQWSEIEALLGAGKIYVQDPSTRLAIDALAPQPDETVLDVCAAPGGKALFVADRMARGHIIAMDLPGARWKRLRENLARLPVGVTAATAESDLRRATPEFFRTRDLPEQFSAVLLDAPCSNTGVMRHRVDVKWRLRLEDFARHGRQQRELLAAAAQLIAPGGRLVYSTCSLDAEENEQVVEAFLAGEVGREFYLESRMLNRPWEAGCDGVGVFRLRRLS